MCFPNKCFVTGRVNTVRHLTLLQVGGEDQPLPAEEPVPGNKVLIPVEWEITRWRDMKQLGGQTLKLEPQKHSTAGVGRHFWEIIRSKSLAQNQGQLSTRNGSFFRCPVPPVPVAFETSQTMKNQQQGLQTAQNLTFCPTVFIIKFFALLYL